MRRISALVLVACIGLFTAVSAVADRPCRRPASPMRSSRDVQSWWRSFRANVVCQARCLPDSAFAEVYAEERAYQESVQDMAERRGKTESHCASLPAFPDPWVFRCWATQYVRRDLEPFLAAVLRHLPTEDRPMVSRRMLLRCAPELHLVGSRLYAASVQVDEGRMTFDPTKCGHSYVQFRHVASHEFVHYLVEATRRKREGPDPLREGMTEYLTVQALEAQGWPVSFPGHEDSAIGVSLLVPIVGPELIRYVLVEDADDTVLYEQIHTCLVDAGLSPEDTQTFVADWQRKDSAQLELIVLAFSAFNEPEELEGAETAFRRMHARERRLQRLQKECAQAREDLKVWDSALEDEDFMVPAEGAWRRFLVRVQKSRELIAELGRIDFGEVTPLTPSSFAEGERLLFAVALGEELPDELSDAQQRLVNVAKGKEGRDRLAAMVSAAKKLLDSEERDIQADLWVIKERVGPVQKRAEELRVAWEAERARERAAVEEIAFHLHERLLRHMTAAGVDVLARQRTAGVPRYFQEKVRELLQKQAGPPPKEHP